MNKYIYHVWATVPKNCTDSQWDDISQFVDEVTRRGNLEVTGSDGTDYEERLRKRFFQFESYQVENGVDLIRDVARQFGVELWGVGHTIHFNVTSE